MVEKEEVISFFDSLASGWDADMVRDEDVIRTILDNAGVCPGNRVIDIACGTGVLIPDYLSRGASYVKAVDISPEMVRIASRKFSGLDSVEIVCCDAETSDLGLGFDNIVIYNAFPHFSNPRNLFRNLVSALGVGGVLTVAHGMSRERVNLHHKRCSDKVSSSLMPAEDLASIMSEFLMVDTVTSNDSMYQICGIKN